MQDFKDFKRSFPFASTNTGGAIVGALGVGALYGGYRGVSRIANKKAAGGTRKPGAAVSATDVIRNSSTRGPKKVVYGPPRNPVRAPRPVAADSPMASVNRAMNVSDKTRANVKRFAKDLRNIYEIPAGGLNEYGTHNWENREMIRDFGKLPSRGNVPGNKATKTRVKFARAQVSSANSLPAQPKIKKKAAARAKEAQFRGMSERYAPSGQSMRLYPRDIGGRESTGIPKDKYGEMSAGEKGALRRKTNKAAAAAKPVMQQGMRARFGGDQPAAPKVDKKPKKPTGPKVPAPTTVDIVPQEPPKPTTPKPSGAGKGKGKATPATSTTVERTFQPGKLPGETNAQASARHKAEHAADRAAEREAKKKVEPKNTTKAPTSAKPPTPPKETPAASGNFLESRGQSLANKQNEMFAPMTKSDRRAAKKLSNKTAYAAGKVSRKGMKARFGTEAAKETPPVERVTMPTYTDRGQALAGRANNLAASAASAPAKEKREAKKAYNRYKHNASRTFLTSQRKRFGPGPGGTPASPSKPSGPSGPSKPSGFVSDYKPQPASDAMTRYGGWGRTARGTIRVETTPEGMKHEMRSRTHRYGPVSKNRLKQDPNTLGSPRLTPISESTTGMFPGTPDKPATGQPHMQGRGAKVVGEQGNFRVWQGPRRTDTVVQHRSGRQLNLPDNPNKTGKVDYSAILDYANKGNNEKAFLKGGWTKDGRTVAGKVGTRSRIARFSIGASKAGGLLSAGGLFAYGVGKLLGPAGAIIGPTNAAAAPGIPGRSYAEDAAKEPNRAVRHGLQRQAVTADRYRAGKTRPFIEPSQYKAIVKKYGPSPFGNYADVVNTSGAYAKKYPNKRYKEKA